MKIVAVIVLEHCCAIYRHLSIFRRRCRKNTFKKLTPK